MKIIMKFIKLLIIGMFFLYYLIVLTLNSVWINTETNPLKFFHAEKLDKINPKLYLSTFPHNITALKSKLHIEHIITISDPRYPISKELIKEEQKICNTLNIQFSILPISYMTTNSIEYNSIKDVLKKSPKVTLIHAYFFDNLL